MKTGTERLFAIFIAAPTGQGDEGDVAPAVLLSNQGGGLVAIELRQRDIHQHELRTELRRDVDSLLSIECSARRVAEHLHHGRQAFTGIDAVIDDEDTAAGGRGGEVGGAGKRSHDRGGRGEAHGSIRVGHVATLYE